MRLRTIRFDERNSPAQLPRLGVLDLGTTIDKRNTVFDEPAHSLRIDAVLLREHACREAVLVIIVEDGHGRLDDDGAAIEVGRYEMHAGAMQFHTAFERTRMRVQARK